GIPFPKRQELSLAPGLVRLTTRLDVQGHDEGTSLRERFDVDHDGKLDPDEAERLGRELAGEAHRTLGLTVDGEPLAMTLTALSDDALVGPVRAGDHMLLAAVWEARVPEMPRWLVLADRENEGMRRVPVVVRVQGARVVSADPWQWRCDGGVSVI